MEEVDTTSNLTEAPDPGTSGAADDHETPELGNEAARSIRERLLRFGESSDGSTHDDGIGLADSVDRVATFAPAILALRWGTTIASIALATQDNADPLWPIVFWCIVITSYSAIRTLSPIRYSGNVRSLVEVIGEVALHVTALCTTGFWDSPFIFTLLTAIAVAGFARGFGFAIRIGTASALAVTIPYLAESNTEERIILSAQWSLVLILVALIAGYARRISGEADRQHTLALDRLGRLADANSLLFSLHRVTQTLPASLDLDDVLDTTITRLRGLFDFDAAAVLGFDETTGDWNVLRKEGTGKIPARIADADLPTPLRRSMTTHSVVRINELVSSNLAGLTDRARSGMYAALTARGSIIGLIAVESSSDSQFSTRDGELLEGLVEPLALAIDNARWFARLRTVGADEERTRIARDLHDRIGQSLAYLAFELDRIVSSNERGEAVGPSLDQLRNDVRGVIGEVRDTLYDLRTDVSDSQDMGAILETYVKRVEDRSDIKIDLHCDRGARLPILQEREMWRVAQEALTNVERHADATRVRILWRCNGESAALEVADNGRGFPVGNAGRLDSYGILGMRERAASIGATLDVASQPGKGTRVRCSLIRTAEPAQT